MKRAIQVFLLSSILIITSYSQSKPVSAQARSGGEVYLPLVMNTTRYIAPPVIPGGSYNDWPAGQLSTIDFTSTKDVSQQPALFYKPVGSGPFPLVVSLHTWSTDYTTAYTQNAQVANWAIANNWVFIHPNFRGPNSTGNTQSMGSDYAVQDIVDAVNYAKTHANVDQTRIYIFAQSGGAHMALLMAGRFPEIWAGVSVWASITDLVAWYNQSLDTTFWDINDKYGNQIKAICNSGGNLDTDCALNRSPVTYLARAAGVPIDINAGFFDGYTGSVPVSHSLISWNLIAPGEAFTSDEIDNITGTPSIEHNIPAYLAFTGSDPLYYDYNNIVRPVLLRKTWNQSRITIFNGTHENVCYWAGLSWLNYLYK